MPAGVGGWDKGMSGGKEGWRRKYAQSAEDEGMRGGHTTAGGLLQSWWWDWIRRRGRGGSFCILHVIICLQREPRLQLCSRLEGEVGLCFAMVPIDTPTPASLKTFRAKKNEFGEMAHHLSPCFPSKRT